VSTPTLPVVTKETLTRTATGERKSVVNRKANHRNARHDVIDRFEDFETAVEALDNDIRLPDRYREQEKERLRNELEADVNQMEIDVTAAGFVELNDRERAVMADLKQPAGDLSSARAFLDSVTDVNAVVDFFQEEIAIGYAPRLHKLLPMIEARIQSLTKGTSDETLKGVVRGMKVTADTWRSKNPSPAQRLREIESERDRIDPMKGNEIGQAFDATKQRLGMRIR
jgi:hypothetical protein